VSPAREGDGLCLSSRGPEYHRVLGPRSHPECCGRNRTPPPHLGRVPQALAVGVLADSPQQGADARLHAAQARRVSIGARGERVVSVGTHGDCRREKERNGNSGGESARGKARGVGGLRASERAAGGRAAAGARGGVLGDAERKKGPFPPRALPHIQTASASSQSSRNHHHYHHAHSDSDRDRDGDCAPPQCRRFLARARSLSKTRAAKRPDCPRSQPNRACIGMNRAWR
jgi:hypothetical protein